MIIVRLGGGRACKVCFLVMVIYRREGAVYENRVLINMMVCVRWCVGWPNSLVMESLKEGHRP